MSLHTIAGGDAADHGGSLVVFCHGLFGQGRNWSGIAKAVQDEHRTLLVDLPHHGRSDWADSVDYVAMAEEVAGLLDAADPAVVVGHSMGGKVAMVLALRHPDLVARLCVVDVAPVDYGGNGEFGRYVRAMQGMDLASIGSRADADAALREAAPDQAVRDFLLQNLRRDSAPGGGGWRWQANLDVLGSSLDRLTGWPSEELAGCAPYDGPVLWVAGAESRYVLPEHDEAMTALFPRQRKVVVKGAGHWVHSAKPEVFVEILRRFAA